MNSLLDTLGRTNNRTQNLSGNRFGKLTVMTESPTRYHKKISWICRCACGEEKTIVGQSLISGVSKSCGCGVREATIRRSTTHGMTKTPEYRAWRQMIGRCENVSIPSYKNYGGRGISVCKKWRLSFDRFLVDVGSRPSRLHSLERKNTNSNYSPKNCTWATRIEQNGNTRRSRYWIVNGSKYGSIKEASSAEDISTDRIYNWCVRFKKQNCDSKLKYRDSP